MTGRVTQPNRYLSPLLQPNNSFSVLSNGSLLFCLMCTFPSTYPSLIYLYMYTFFFLVGDCDGKGVMPSYDTANASSPTLPTCMNNKSLNPLYQYGNNHPFLRYSHTHSLVLILASAQTLRQLDGEVCAKNKKNKRSSSAGVGAPDLTDTTALPRAKARYSRASSVVGPIGQNRPVSLFPAQA
ncbi:hypothetical protein K457DRAFT_37115 [Linnemannia elongata AG-77]|uniref:Uncharacterized protein n=1 Tax=Linnemannia elongata AG-77 TaxID=1314771 RepID=A0A197JDP5_9FUNG|nr:hypothetical protein K457DRAFT_37115 [Linnemannia elongata AG-77]